MAKRPRKLEPWQVTEVRILAASGYELADIAAELELDEKRVEPAYRIALDRLGRHTETLERLHSLRESLVLRRDRAGGILRKFQRSLPKVVSTNGLKDSHQWQLARAIQLERELAQMDALILRTDLQIADVERQTGGGNAAIPTLTLNINTGEQGDYPARYGEVVSDGSSGDDGDD